MTDPDGGLFTYAYDAAGRPDYLVNPLAERTTWTYDDASRTTEKALANGSKATYTYDAADRVTRVANVTSAGTMISSFDYSYDNVGNRTRQVEADGTRVSWTYDKTYQLEGEHRDQALAWESFTEAGWDELSADGWSGMEVSGTQGGYRTTHTYDPVGNRLLKEANGARVTYTYDAANQLSTSETAFETTTYSYDATGNLQFQEAPSGRTTNTWDAENRLTLVEAPGGVINTMTYNAAGLRVQKQDSSGTSKFILDGQNILLETDGADTTQAAYTLQPGAFGPLISQRRGANSHFFHLDALGSVAGLTNASQVLTDAYLYKAYGEILAASGSTVNPFRWVGSLGYYYDLDLLQYYMRARHYAPVLARWLSMDPIGFGMRSTSGDELGRFISRDPIGYSDGYNLYGYVNSQPTFYVDPSGLYTFGDFLLGSCGRLQMRCNFGERYFTRVIPNSAIADLFLLGGSGCVTLPDGIYCTGSCDEIKKSKSRDNPKRTLLEHEACHYCALKDYGYCAYLKTAGRAPDACVGDERPAKPIW